MKEHKKYVCTDAGKNNNKFWEYYYDGDDDQGQVIVKYGRVGSTCTTEPSKTMTRKKLESIIRDKTKPGRQNGTYREIIVVAADDVLPTGPQMAKTVVAEAAKLQLARNDVTLVRLVDRLVAANKHELHQASGGQLNVDLTTGIISTPVGVVTKDNVTQARVILDQLAPYVTKSDFDAPTFVQNINDYLMLVPQKVGHSRGWHRLFITDVKGLQRQSSLLDQLEASAELATARMVAAASAGASNTTSVAEVPNLFTAKITQCTDRNAIKKIDELFYSNVNKSHESARLRPVAYYEVELPEAKAAYDADGAKLTNQWLLWHGTRMFNVLSILKSGLIIPKSGGSYQITGRMFADGLYFSDQSTKSLNYSYGYWDGNARDAQCFMFLADVAMGKYHIPNGYGMKSLPGGFDSCFAKAGTGGVRNNEMIVYRLSQANLRYLVEFNEK